MSERLTIGTGPDAKVFTSHKGEWIHILGYVLVQNTRFYGFDTFRDKAYMTDKLHAQIFPTEDDVRKFQRKHKLSGEVKPFAVKADPFTCFPRYQEDHDANPDR